MASSLSSTSRYANSQPGWPTGQAATNQLLGLYSSNKIPSYANICEQCDNYVPDPAHRDIIDAQLADVTALRDDADLRGWTDERARHQHVADALANHLRTIENHQPANTAS